MVFPEMAYALLQHRCYNNKLAGIKSKQALNTLMNNNLRWSPCTY